MQRSAMCAMADDGWAHARPICATTAPPITIIVPDGTPTPPDAKPGDTCAASSVPGCTCRRVPTARAQDCFDRHNLGRVCWASGSGKGAPQRTYLLPAQVAAGERGDRSRAERDATMTGGPSGRDEAFTDVRSAARLMASFPRPWYVAGGWAIDLHLGRVTRDHEDVDLAIFREDQATLRRHLSGWELRKAVPSPAGGALLPWGDDEWLALPIHEIHARHPAAVPAAVEVLLDEREGDAWRFRRDPRVSRPLALIGRRALSVVPYLAPEIALLYKARHHAAKDDADFRAVTSRLEAEPRDWLRAALRICYPEHPWLARLE